MGFAVEQCFGLDVDFEYFDLDELLDVLQIHSEIRNSKRIISLVKDYGRRHKIIQIAKRQIAFDLLKDVLDQGVLEYDPFFKDKRILASTKDRLYDAQERFLMICLSIAQGRSVRSIRKLQHGFDSRELREYALAGKSLFRYFRGMLNDHTREFILAFKGQSADALRDDPNSESISGISGPVADIPSALSSSVSSQDKKSTVKKVRQVSFSDEILTANALFLEGRDILQAQVQLMKAGAPLDVARLEWLADDLIRSYQRNPFALLALRHVKDSQHYLVQHLLGAAVLSIHFAYVIGLSSAYIKAIAVGGMLFDIGRFRLPEVLSAKTTKLTPVEFDLFRKHIDFSLHAIRQTEGLVKLIYQMVDDHHEKVDGSGYPKGKQDDEISVYGKMAAIIDAYDALTSEQQHKASMGPVKACQQLLREAGLAFDAKLVQAFVASMGSYPVGTCVALTNGRAGFVITLNKQNQPALVRQVFSLRQKNFIAATDISVDPNSFNAGDVAIDAEIDPQQYGIKFINHLI